MSTANFYNDDCFNIYTGNEFKSDNFEFHPSQMNYSYYNMDKNYDIDPTMDTSNYVGFNTINGIDYLTSDLDDNNHPFINGCDLNEGVIIDPVKPFNTDYINCESFSTRYTDGSFDNQNSQNNINLNYNMDSLTESMLKQLDTPKLFSQNESEIPDSLRLNSLDPNMIKRLYDAGININQDIKDDYYNNIDNNNNINNNNNNEQYYDCLGNELDTSRKDRFRNNTRRRGKRPEDTKSIIQLKTVSQIKSPTLKSNIKTKNVSKTTFGGLNYNWLKDSFFNCQILGNVVSIAQDQTGCRMLQRQLECNDYQFISSVLNEVLDNLFMLMTDPFGNYLCQKLMSVCDSEQLGLIITACEPQFISICLNMHGTRAIQKLIEVVTDNNINRITSILSTGVVDLVNDLNGNHVIQKCLVSLSSKHCDFIYKAMNDNCVYLATHRHGCCVMQRCIDAASPTQRSQLVDTISSKTLELVEDAYGNYVIQYVLRLKDDIINSRIVSFLCEDVTKFAKQKFSSNVVERCLIFCPLEVRSTLINKFLDVPFEVLKDLILDPFGNYVIQRVLNVAQPEELTSLLERIQPHLEELKVASSGKRIAAKISRRSNTCTTLNTNNGNNITSGINTNTNSYNGSGSIFDMFNDNTEDPTTYPGYLSNEYPSLTSNINNNTDDYQKDNNNINNNKNDINRNVNNDRDYIIDLINKTNTNTTNDNDYINDFANKERLNLEFPSLNSTKFDKNDILTRDFCDLFDAEYNNFNTDSFPNKLWTSDM